MNGTAETELTRRVREEIAASGGAIPFERYMERALYEPELGYYERSPANVGREGDFYTSVSVGPLFGELLAFHLFPRLETLAQGGPVELVEAGAHDGKLAADLLGALDRFAPTLADRLTYRIVEPSGRRRCWQREHLARFAPRVTWSEALPSAFRGFLVANELLDAFPLERWRWRATTGRWVKQGVVVDGAGFAWADLGDPQPVAWELPAELAEVLPDGFVREACPGSTAWWRRAAEAVTEGGLLTFDYGSPLIAGIDPMRPEGTLRGYRAHRFADSVLEAPGEVDLTAHVDFTPVREAGEAAGLRTDFDGSQSGFLAGLVEGTLAEEDRFGAWDPKRVRAFQTLTHPQHLGRSFRALFQVRDGTGTTGIATT